MTALVQRKAAAPRLFSRVSGPVAFGVGALALFAVVALAAPLLASDPNFLELAERLRPPGLAHLFGTDQYGRDILARTMHGARVSLLVALAVGAATTFFGLAFGIIAGFFKAADLLIMRIVDGLMAIPALLLAVAVTAIGRPSVTTVVVAITIAEVPRMTRLVRGVVLGIKDRTFIEAARLAGARLPSLLVRHVLPNTLGPLSVQATYVCASAILIEAGLSFLGAGVPTEVPTWGGIIAEGRSQFQSAPWVVLFPSACLFVAILSVNLLGDALRDATDPTLVRRLT